MKSTYGTAVATAALLMLSFVPSTSGAQDIHGKQAGDFRVRVRVLGVLPQDPNSDVRPVGGQAEASDVATAEGDFTYFFTPNIAAELIAAAPRHRVTLRNSSLTPGGELPLGDTNLLPPTLTAQYHFLPDQAFSPYVGVGINYTWFFDTTPARPTVTSFNLSGGFGAVLQAGVDYEFAPRWSMNFDVKQIFLTVDAGVNGAIAVEHDLNPTIVGFGLGYTF